VKVRRPAVKPTRSCDDWYEDDAPHYVMGAAYDMSDEAPRFRSVSEAAHHAMRATNRPTIGFHRPKA
jgi:hypothetical protein